MQKFLSRGGELGLVVLGVVLLPALALAAGPWLPQNVSTIGVKVDRLYRIIFYLTATIFFLTEGTLVFFIFKYRERPGRKAFYFPEQNTLEIAWWIVPGCILFFLALYQWNTWAQVKRYTPPEANSVRVEVLAQQFAWNIRYPGPDHRFGTSDDLVAVNELKVPVNKPVIIQLRSKDVIHSFFLPELRIKQDTVPGMTVKIWFQATKKGNYDIACAELCGLGHFKMMGRLIVLSPQNYEKWLQSMIQKKQPVAPWGWRWEKTKRSSS